MDALQTARTVLRRAEWRVGVVAQAERVPDVAPADAVPRPLTELLAGGRFPVGAASSVTGSRALLVALLAAVQRPLAWTAVVAMPELGILAAVDAGVDLERLVLVPVVREHPATVIAALLDGIDTVVIGSGVRLTGAERRRLTTRARERGAALVATSRWEASALDITVTGQRWSGPDRGAFYVRRGDLVVQRRARGAAQVHVVDVALKVGHHTAQVRDHLDVVRRTRLRAV